MAELKINSETSRIRAALVNSGRFSFPEADAKIAASELSVVIGHDASGTPAGQAAFLTAIATAARCFGRVTVAGALEGPLLVPAPIYGETLLDAAVGIGAYGYRESASANQISIGGGGVRRTGWEAAPHWDGWIAGVRPASPQQQPGRSDCVLAGVAAGALAIGQAFLKEQGDPRAGKLEQSVSLWSPHTRPADNPGPRVGDISLPRALWLLGLGNLGQAYLWSLFMLPYAEPERVMLFLQDDDLVDSENWGTSVLVKRGRYEVLKTKIAEEWTERRKFGARRIDRRFDEHCRRGKGEPGIALSGLDQMSPRRLLGRAGFEYVIDCGLGATAATFQDFRINVFDRTADPERHFEGVEDNSVENASALLRLAAYQELVRQRNDGGCGAALLATKAVAVPFVSAFAAALAITQAIRIASAEAPHKSITGTTGDIKTLRATPGVRPERAVVDSVATQPYPTLPN